MIDLFISQYPRSYEILFMFDPGMQFSTKQSHYDDLKEDILKVVVKAFCVFTPELNKMIEEGLLQISSFENNTYLFFKLKQHNNNYKPQD